MPTGVYKHKPIPKKIRKKISKALTGKKLTKEHKRNIGKPGKGQHRSVKTEFKKGHKSGMTGKKHTEKTKEKIRQKMMGMEIFFKPYTTDWTNTLKRSIRERDKYICRLCGKLQGDRAFDVHHIDYDKKNCDPNNLITLCKNCHTKTSHNRKYWSKILNNLSGPVEVECYHLDCEKI